MLNGVENSNACSSAHDSDDVSEVRGIRMKTEHIIVGYMVKFL
jgi:hypothetical protein